LVGGPIQIRAGIHTGTPLVAEGGYVGVDVHRAARIAACGSGGQVLVSAATAALVGTDELRDLGEHRLKDLSAPERLYQLGGREFPPLRTLYRTNLPIPATLFVGREQELAEVVGQLSQESVRLLTLTGPGGTGKTRLALQAAAEASERYPDGVFWVPLAPLRDPELVVPTAGQALGAKDGLAEHIGDHSMLLLLDNFEHLVGAADDLSKVLAACPNVQLLVTSRELLRLPGEHAFPVPPLEPSDGMDLFLARARAMKPDFQSDQAVRDLCARLENLPLALELAAARIGVLAPEQLVERISQRLDLLKAGRGVDPRQQTLRATIEWSYDLLGEGERRLFARLAVFRGGCPLEATEDVCGADIDTLQSLVDKSLLRRREDRVGASRFSMLETIREYGQEKLQLNREEDQIRRRHAAYMLGLVERAGDFTGVDQKEWADRFEEEHDNLRAALDWSEAAGEAETALLLANGVVRFWWLHGHYHEGRLRLERALAIGDAPAPLRAESINSISALARLEGDLERAKQSADEALARFEDLGDKLGIGNALTSLGIALSALGELDEAERLHSRALVLFRELGEPQRISVALTNLSEAALQRGEYKASERNARQVLAIGEEIGDKQVMAIALHHLGVAASGRNHAEEATEWFARSLALSRELEPRLGIASLVGLATVLAASDPQGAIRVLAAAEASAETIDLAIEPTEQILRDHTLAACRKTLAEKRLDELWGEGRQMSLDVAADYAFERARLLLGSAT
jgi:predicted ATPase